MSSYQANRAWSDKFLPNIRALVGPHLLVPSNLEQDTKQATDLIVLLARDMRIAARVRRFGFAAKYPRQFTLRSQLESGVMTEFRKVLNGWGDWLFYGHSDQAEQTIDPWLLVDLSSLRTQLAHEAVSSRKTIQQGQGDNHDGTYFQWFDVDSFQSSPPILIAESGNPWPARGRVPEWPRQQRITAKPTCKHKPEYMKEGRCWVCDRMAAPVGA